MSWWGSHEVKYFFFWDVYWRGSGTSTRWPERYFNPVFCAKGVNTALQSRGCGGTVTGRYLCVLRGTLVCLRRRFPTGSLTDWRNLCKDGDGKSCGVRGSHTILESQKNSLLAPVPTRTEFRVEDHRKCVEWVFSLALASWYGGGRTQGGMPMGQEEGG